MPLLLHTDYEELKARGLKIIEDEPNRFIVFPQFRLPTGVYQQPAADVLVSLPRSYNQDGNDMFWTYPRLIRADGAPIPATNEPGGGDNRVFDGKEFCRWSRHWNHGLSVWKAGRDNIVTILRRLEWAFGNPNVK